MTYPQNESCTRWKAMGRNMPRPWYLLLKILHIFQHGCQSLFGGSVLLTHAHLRMACWPQVTPVASEHSHRASVPFQRFPPQRQHAEKWFRHTATFRDLWPQRPMAQKMMLFSIVFFQIKESNKIKHLWDHPFLSRTLQGTLDHETGWFLWETPAARNNYHL
jgi:hypothetical protein